VSTLPREAREGLMRAWLELLKERHPTVTWIPATAETTSNNKEETLASK